MSHSAVSCPLCASERVRLLWTLNLPGHPGPFCLRKCLRCGIIFNYPRRSADSIRDQYDAGYYVFHERPERRWGRATQLYVEHLLPLETRIAGRRLLEIGCARGELLALARQRGWQTTGVEISPEASSAARIEHGLDVRTGSLDEHTAELGWFDVAIANDVIEHVPSPRNFLVSVRSVLKPRGLLSLETPNWGGFWRRIGGPKWLGINRFHVFLFDAACLQRLMSECGFTNIEVGSSDNYAYSNWGSRPELATFINRLPVCLRWRAERLLDSLSSRSGFQSFAQNPPATLDEAVKAIEPFVRTVRGLSRRLNRDNLTVIGRA